MHDVLVRESHGRAWRGVTAVSKGAVIASLIFAAWLSSCSSSDSSTGINLVVVVDPLLGLDNVNVAIRAVGKAPSNLTFAPLPTTPINIVTKGLGTGAAVNLEVSGSKSDTTVVLARARAVVVSGRHVTVTVQLALACVGMLSCKEDQTCNNGECAEIPTRRHGSRRRHGRLSAE